MGKTTFAPLPIVEPLQEPAPASPVDHLQKLVKKCVKRLKKLRTASLSEQFELITATALWASCSIGMTVLNKLAVNRTRAPLAVVVVQMLATCVMSVASGNLKFGQGWKTWALSVPPLFVMMMASSMLALQHVTVGTFVVVRNLGPVVTLGIETALHRPDNLSCDLKTTTCLLAIALGVFLYEAQEVKLSPTGLFYLFANLGFACAERLLQRHLLAVQSVDVSKPALMLLNNGIGAVLTAVAMAGFAPKEWHYLMQSVRHKVRAADCCQPSAIRIFGYL